MIEGVLRHCTDMDVERQYVDSHGQSEVGFRLLPPARLRAAPRLKGIARQKLLPAAGRACPGDCPTCCPSSPASINWDLIEQQYDEMVKYATALRLGTPTPEAILRRFTRDERACIPTYKALAELGKAVKTIFLCRYLRPRRCGAKSTKA